MDRSVRVSDYLSRLMKLDSRGTTTSQERPVAYFDFDDTLVFADSMLHWQRWYARRRRLWAVALWIWGILPIRLFKGPLWMKRAYMATCNRETVESRANLVRQFSREFLSQTGLAEMLERIWMHFNLGHRIVVVTASPSFYLAHLEDLLPPHELVATELDFQGRHVWNLPELVGQNVKGHGKLQVLAERGYVLPSTGSYAYSDHISDAPLLEAVEFAFAVRPDEELEFLARQKGWPILKPVEPWSEEKTRISKALWLVFGPLGPSWPHSKIPQGKQRKRMWHKWSELVVSAWKEAAKENRQGFSEICRELERVSTRLKGVAPRMARALIQKPLIQLGHSAQPGLDRVWATGQSLAMSPSGLDSLQKMVYQSPGCEAARLVLAPVGSDGLFQTYRIRRGDRSDRILKLLLPGIREAVAHDIETEGNRSELAHDPNLRRAWEGLLAEFRPNVESECDLEREVAIGARLRKLFPDPSTGIFVPRADQVSSNGYEGLVLETVDGFPLSAYLAYLRETRRLRDPKMEPTADYDAFAALIANAPPLPQGRELSGRIWKLLSRTWFDSGLWLTLSGTEDVSVVLREEGWLLSMSDFAGSVQFPEWCPHALRDWNVVCPEGSSELVDLCKAMGWGDHHLEAFHGKHRSLVEMVWHPVLAGTEQGGFAFDDWRLDGRLTSLLGPGHQYENWPVPEPCRRVFRTLWWLRRCLAAVGMAD